MFRARSDSARANRFDALPSDRLFEQRLQVRSLLALMRAIVRGTAMTCAAEDYAAQLSDRLDVISRVQEMLMRRPAVGIDLLELVEDEFLAQRAPSLQITLIAAPLLLQRRFALLMALAVHELTANAIQFGALRTPRGRLTTRWESNPVSTGWTLFEWREEFSDARDAGISRGSEGFGFRFIRNTLACEIGARTHLSLQPDGMICQIVFRASGPGH